MRKFTSLSGRFSLCAYAGGERGCGWEEQMRNTTHGEKFDPERRPRAALTLCGFYHSANKELRAQSPAFAAVCFPGKQSMIAVRGVKWLLKGCSVIKFTT